MKLKLSTRSTYGMRALVVLALSGGHGPVSASLIASRQHLSVAYLEQLLHRLKKQRVVLSVRGPRGGYLLAKDPSHITIAEVVRVLEGGEEATGAPRRSTQRQASRAAARPQQAERIAQAVWHCVHERVMQSLGEITLKDLCDEVRTQDGEPIDHRYVFHI